MTVRKGSTSTRRYRVTVLTSPKQNAERLSPERSSHSHRALARWYREASMRNRLNGFRRI